ncbi:MAG: hypothetical protein ACI92Z_001118 [Paracoccaceae bacterium]
MLCKLLWNCRYMKPGFALSLSFEGISLLHRAAGGWRTVGEVTLESADLSPALAELRDKAGRLEPDGLACKLIIPNEQIRYLTVETGGAEDGLRTEMVLAALDGATPYPVSDLAFDFSIEGDMTHIAAVARETLAEAEAFAVEHLFNPVSFVAVPGDNLYLGEPNFGPTSHAAEFLGGDRADADHIAVVVIGMADIPKFVPKPEPELPVAGFATRRRRTPVADPVLVLDSSMNTLVKTVIEPTPEAIPKAPSPIPAPISAPISAPIAAAKRPEISESQPATTAPSLEGATRQQDVPAPVSIDDSDASGAPAVAVPLAKPLATFAEEQPRPKVEIPEKKTSFLSRRKDKKTAVAAATPHRVAPVEMSAVPAADEEQRMTVFGARTDPDVGGKPRYLGLVLTAVLLLFLAGIAAWASLFMDTKLSRWLFLDPADYELAAEPEPTQEPPITADTQTSEAQLPAQESLIEDPVVAALPPAEPDLSDTDAAVLDALRATAENAETDIAAMGIAVMKAVEISGQDTQKTLETPAIIGLDDLYIASIDRTDLSHDAVALPSLASLQTDVMPGSISSPAAADTKFALDERGLVTPTVNGTVNPDGVIVYLGQLPARPPPTPARDDPEAEQQDVQNYLATLRPLARPDNLMELVERARLGGLTRAELGRVRPLMRPERPVIAEVAPETVPVAEPEAEATGTKLAVAISVKPLARPKGLAKTKQTANLGSVAAITQVATIAPRTVKPSIPSSASVARQATLDNAINLRKINLIGVYGTSANRRALVRLPSGRYKKIKVGDRIDGGQVLAISDSELRYQKAGRNMTLKIPNG